MSQENSKYIDVYTRKNAIEDGIQFKVSQLFCSGLFKIPVYVCTSIMPNQSESVRLMALLCATNKAIKEDVQDNQVSFKFEDTTIYVQIGATDIDNPAPALTIMKAEDL